MRPSANEDVITRIRKWESLVGVSHSSSESPRNGKTVDNKSQPDKSLDSFRPGTVQSGFRLLVESGPAKGREFALSGTDADIGRSDQNDIALHDVELSRRHCRLEFRGGELWVSDLASANGTVVNGREIRECPLHDGDILSIGTSTIRIIGRSGEVR